MNERLEKLTKALLNDKNILPTPRIDTNNYLMSAISYIKKTSTNDNKSIINCTYDSIVRAINESIELQVPLDNRDLAFIEKRYNKDIGKHEASLGLQYRAYFFKLSQLLDSFDGEAFCVYEGDEIETEDKDGFHSYTYRKKDLFASGKDKIKGVIVRLTYKVGDEPRQKLGIVSVEEIMKIRSKAKTKFIWDEWFDEKAKAAATRRACKGVFDIALGIKGLVDYENNDYDLSKKVDVIEDVDKVVESKYISEEQVNKIKLLIKETSSDGCRFLEWIGFESIEEIPADCYEIAIEALSKKSVNNGVN